MKVVPFYFHKHFTGVEKNKILTNPLKNFLPFFLLLLLISVTSAFYPKIVLMGLGGLLVTFALPEFLLSVFINFSVAIVNYLFASFQISFQTQILGILCLFSVLVAFVFRMRMIPRLIKIVKESFLILVIPLLIAGLLYLGVARSHAPIYGAEKSMMFWLACAVPAGGFLLYFKIRRDRINWLLLWVLIAGLVLSILALQEFYQTGFAHYYRTMPLGINPIWGGRFISVSFVALWMLKDRIFKLKIGVPIFFLLGALLLGGIVACGSRGPVVALMISYLFVYFFRLLARKNLREIFYLSIIIAVIIAAMSVLPVLVPRFSLENAESDNNVSARILMNQMALKGWLEGNWLLGEGTGSFGYLWHFADARGYPHNIFTETLYENGFIGFFLLSVYILGCLKRGIKFLGKISENTNKLNESTRILSEFGFLLLILGMVNSCFSGDISSWGNNWIWLGGSLLEAGRAESRMGKTEILGRKSDLGG